MPTHNLLWTSGWDSTFRLLQIIITNQNIVQPIYIIDRSRKSYQKELEAIEKIKLKIKEEFPEAYSLILPTRFIEKKDLIINKEISESYSTLNALIKTGSQYEWLAQFCRDNNLNHTEISIEKNPNPKSFVYFLTQNYIQTTPESTSNKGLYHTIDILFKYFSFPVINLTKLDMLAIIEKNKWKTIMNLTWFCHKPKNNKPCGKCVPCLGVIKKGLGYRISTVNRLKGYFKIYIKNK